MLRCRHAIVFVAVSFHMSILYAQAHLFAMMTLAPLWAAPNARALPAPPAPMTTTILPFSGDSDAASSYVLPAEGRESSTIDVVSLGTH